MAERRRRRHRGRQQEVRNARTFGELGLSQAALRSIGDMGYDEPTPVQAQAIPAVLGGRDVMAAAQTGTGKTAAFLLPALDRLGHTGRGQGPLMLVVTPTRELAQQITDVANVVGAQTRHRTTVVVGGVGYEPQKDALARGCDVLVATPGRLIDLLDQGACSLGQVEVLVLDEADRMLDMGFLPDMRKIVARTPRNRQTLLFSATLSEDVLSQTSSLVKDPVRVEIAPKGTAAETVRQYVLGVSPEAKKRLLPELLKREGTDRVIVFVKGKHRADQMCRILRRSGIGCAPIHGNRSQNQRARALAQFMDGEVGVLVATDVLARGIDVPEVAYVLNLDVPHEAEDYIHRIGRTGRAGERGWALTLCTEDEYLDLRDIEQLMGTVIPDYPHAEGLDLGAHPCEMDPARNPRDRLPGKKARKRMAKAREEARAKGESARAATHKPETSAPKVSVAASKPESRSNSGKPRPKAGSKSNPGAASKPRQTATGATKPKKSRAKRSASKPSGASPRRHPGDRRGMNRRGA